ncbi:MAG: flagellar FliJ family protein, partial [Vicinamibacterales bacterium]
LGEARAALERSERAVHDSLAALDATLARGTEAVSDPGLSIWYRNWITRQRDEIGRRRTMVGERQAAVDAAIGTLHAAHRDVRVLERLRDRLHEAWLLAERRKEQKELDWLGSVRHALRAASQENLT